jgi:hypothetical protein
MTHVPYTESDVCWCQPFNGPAHPNFPMHGAPMTPQENAWLHRNADVDYPHSMTLDPKPNTSARPGLSGSICIGILSALAIEVVAALIIWGCRMLL